MESQLDTERRKRNLSAVSISSTPSPKLQPPKYLRMAEHKDLETDLEILTDMGKQQETVKSNTRLEQKVEDLGGKD